MHCQVNGFSTFEADHIVKSTTHTTQSDRGPVRPRSSQTGVSQTGVSQTGVSQTGVSQTAGYTGVRPGSDRHYALCLAKCIVPV